jgi:uncharacterized protein (DUF433 family)
MSTEIGTLLISTPDICGGRLRIDGTRITIHQIATLYKGGLNAEEIADQYPYLTMAQVYAALAYYHANKEEIEADLGKEIDENVLTGRLEKEAWWKAFKELQRRVNLTPAKAAQWQALIREARR